MKSSLRSLRTGTYEPMASFQLNKPNELLKTGLLSCGIVAPLLYVSFDIFAAMQYDGYSYNSQTISELFGLNAPTRPIEMLFGPVYTVLLVAFALGIGLSAVAGRRLTTIATMVLVYAIVEQVNLMYFPLHLRGTEHTLRDTIHVVLTVFTALSMIIIVALGATTFSRTFRLYSLITIVLLIAFAGIAGLDATKLDTNEATPWMGIAERINVYGFMLWLIVFAIALLRKQKRIVIIKHPLSTIARN